ncbi:MAG: 16S rRNA (guanine(527)-N(7))-methyltransferase RsmG, partial [Candidatus Eiseniibacteriota bacterium]
SAPRAARRRPADSARGTSARRPAGTKPVARDAIEQVIDRQPWETLRPALVAPGADVERALDRLRRYAELLLEWNRTVSNIVSRHDEERILERHLLESVAPAGWLRKSGGTRWIDFGSGAGFPAIPLAIAGVGGTWTLVESRRTKTLFIRKTIQNIVLHDFEVINDRLENVVRAGDRSQAFDGFTSRATLPLGPTLALASPLVSAGGSAFLWKGSRWEQEMERDSAWRRDWEASGTAAVGTGPNIVTRFIRKQID